MIRYTMLHKYGNSTREILGRFYLHFTRVLYVLGAFSTKQLFHSRLLDMR